MKQPLYRQALRESWHTIIHHKTLWVFGLLSALLGQMGLLSMFLKVGFIGTNHSFFPGWMLWPELFGGGGAQELSTFSSGEWAGLGILFFLLACIWLTVFFIAASSQGALIFGVSRSLAHPRRHVDVGKAWHAGAVHGWRVLCINIIKQIVVLFLGIVMGSALLSALIAPGHFDGTLFVLLFILSAIVGVVVSLLSVYAVCYIVIEDQRMFDAVASAWKLFADHWLVSLEVGMILLGINMVVGSAAIVSYFVLFLPAMLLWVLAASFGGSVAVFIAMIACFTLFFLFIVILGAVCTAFVSGVWTSLFTHMHRRGVVSRLLHWGRFHHGKEHYE